MLGGLRQLLSGSGLHGPYQTRDPDAPSIYNWTPRTIMNQPTLFCILLIIVVLLLIVNNL